jgi:radical SAM superfamily enzyme YgiQ (UPF0313 family)
MVTVRRFTKLFVLEPLELEYLAAGIHPEHDVRILDLRIERHPDRAFKNVLKQFRPEMVGFTCYSIQVRRIWELARRTKHICREALVVVGGHHATVSPSDFCVDEVDVIVKGDGVFPCREILDAYQNGNDLSEITGLALPRNGKLIHTPKRPYPPLDEFPFPIRDLVDRRRYFDIWIHSKYHSGEPLHRQVAAIRTSMGCTHRCSFCAMWMINEGRYFTRSPQSIVEELSQIEEDFIYLADDETFLDTERMMELADKIERAGIRKRYFAYIRSQTVLENPELISRWRSIGLDRVFVGIESFRDDELREYHKGSTTRRNEMAVDLLKGKGIVVFVAFIVNPSYSLSDFTDLYNTLDRYDGCEFSFSILTPAPGTKLREIVRERMIVDTFDFIDGWHTLLPTKVPIKEFYRQFAGLYREGRRHSLSRHFSLPFREALPVIYRSQRLYAAIRNCYKDYRSLNL